MKKRMDLIGILILVCLFGAFYLITSMALDKVKRNEEIKEGNSAIEDPNTDYNDEIEVVNRLYQNVRMLYDVVNSKFKVSQDDIIVMNEITYKKIINFNAITNGLFTENGLNKYIRDLGSYFAYTNGNYYLAGNLVSYQTYYFRGDASNIYILDASDEIIDAIIYEKWTSSNKNTLATIRVVKENNEWLIDNISILANE